MLCCKMEDAHYLISSLHNSITRHLLIGPELNSVDFTSIGITKINMSTFLCHHTSPISFENLIRTQVYLNIPHFQHYPSSFPKKSQQQYALPPDNSPQLSNTLKTRGQSIIGSLLYYKGPLTVPFFQL